MGIQKKVPKLNPISEWRQTNANNISFVDWVSWQDSMTIRGSGTGSTSLLKAVSTWGQIQGQMDPKRPRSFYNRLERTYDENQGNIVKLRIHIFPYISIYFHIVPLLSIAYLINPAPHLRPRMPVAVAVVLGGHQESWERWSSNPSNALMSP